MLMRAVGLAAQLDEQRLPAHRDDTVRVVLRHHKLGGGALEGVEALGMALRRHGLLE